MSIRAKFKVEKFESSLLTRKKDPSKAYDTENIETVEIRTIVLSPVYANSDPNHENSKFWAASPSGQITLGTVNPGAWKQFELGKEYYIDFTPAD